MCAGMLVLFEDNNGSEVEHNLKCDRCICSGAYANNVKLCIPVLLVTLLIIVR